MNEIRENLMKVWSNFVFICDMFTRDSNQFNKPSDVTSPVANYVLLLPHSFARASTICRTNKQRIGRTYCVHLDKWTNEFKQLKTPYMSIKRRLFIHVSIFCCCLYFVCISSNKCADKCVLRYNNLMSATRLLQGSM